MSVNKWACRMVKQCPAELLNGQFACRGFLEEINTLARPFASLKSLLWIDFGIRNGGIYLTKSWACNCWSCNYKFSWFSAKKVYLFRTEHNLFLVKYFEKMMICFNLSLSKISPPLPPPLPCHQITCSLLKSMLICGRHEFGVDFNW